MDLTNRLAANGSEEAVKPAGNGNLGDVGGWRSTVTVSRLFDYCRTSLANGEYVDDVAYGGYMPLNGGGAGGRRLGRQIGRIHHRFHDGVWYATPDSGNWSDLQWFGPFYSRREAAMFLAGIHHGRVS